MKDLFGIAIAESLVLSEEISWQKPTALTARTFVDILNSGDNGVKNLKLNQPFEDGTGYSHTLEYYGFKFATLTDSPLINL